MATTTTRLALIKPDTTEDVDIADLNANTDQLDQMAGCILVNDGVTPAAGDLFDGAIVKEKTSGIIWEARKSGATFLKKYIRYPYSLFGVTGNNPASGTTFVDWGFSSVTTALCKNSSNADFNASNFWECPVKGIYIITWQFSWEYNATGTRAQRFTLNGSATETQKYGAWLMSATTEAGYYTTGQLILGPRSFNVGDEVGFQQWQNSGTAIAYEAQVQIAMVEPI